MTKFAKNGKMRALLLPVAFIFCVACLNRTDKEKGVRPDSPQTATAQAPLPNTQPVDPAKVTSIEWLDSAKHLGAVTEGEIVKLSYKFRNSGSKPLVIESVLPGCGCTVADYPKQAIAPGQEGEIKAEFDSHGRVGVQNKNITVYANTSEKTFTLHFSLTVNKKS